MAARVTGIFVHFQMGENADLNRICALEQNNVVLQDQVEQLILKTQDHEKLVSYYFIGFN